MAPTIQWQLPSPSKVRRTTALNKRIFLMLVGVIAVFSGSLVLAYHALLSSGSTTAQAAAPPSSHEHLRARSTAAVISAVRERLQAHGAEAEQQQPTRPEPRRRQSEVAAAAAAAAAAATAALAGPHRCLPIDGGPAVALPSALMDDDYCDCADGSDEPHTSACAGVAASARFACERDPSDRPLSRSGGPSDSPHAPVTIAASRVHDGVCDCCDGSDEPPSANCTSERCEVLEAAKSAQVAERLEGIRLRDVLAALPACKCSSRRPSPFPHRYTPPRCTRGKGFVGRTGVAAHEECAACRLCRPLRPLLPVGAGRVHVRGVPLRARVAEDGGCHARVAEEGGYHLSRSALDLGRLHRRRIGRLNGRRIGRRIGRLHWRRIGRLHERRIGRRRSAAHGRLLGRRQLLGRRGPLAHRALRLLGAR
jgi:hypothetical protein